MKSFVIIFRQGSRPLSDADLARRQQSVTAWAREQNAAGHTLEPRILAPEVVRPGAVPAGAGDSGANGWPVTALLFLEAADLAAAAQVASSHPANHFGALTEVRAWSLPSPPATANR